MLDIERWLAQRGLAANRFVRVLQPQTNRRKDIPVSSLVNLVSNGRTSIKSTHYQLVVRHFAYCLGREPMIGDLIQPTLVAFKLWLIEDRGLAKGTVAVYLRASRHVSKLREHQADFSVDYCYLRTDFTFCQAAREVQILT